MQRFEGDGRGLLHPDEHGAALVGAQLSGEGRAEQNLARLRPGHTRDAVELPEPIVDAVHLDARRTAAGGLIDGDAVNDHQRHDVAEAGGKGLVALDLVGQRVAEEAARRGHDQVGATDAPEDQRTKAAADRVADEQGP